MSAVPLISIEDAPITRLAAVQRIVPAGAPARALFNKVDTYRGEKDEVFFAVVREAAPCCYLQQRAALNKLQEFEQANALGQAFTVGTTQNRVTMTWSFLLGATSLRAPKELTHGGPGVVGAYDLLNALLDTTTGLKGWAPVAGAEQFQFVGWELLGQTTSAVVFDAHFRTRVQL